MSVRFEIHPSIGVARVGNSEQHFIFDGPNSANLPRRDAAGRLIKQGAEFRVYRCARDQNGRITDAQEVTIAGSRIEWSVHLVNKKASALRFQDDSRRRNNAAGDDQVDRDLIIDTGVQTLTDPERQKSLGGFFRGQAVRLGAMQFGVGARLVVTGGDGSAGSPTNDPILNFADNDGWFDTVSDGLVRARVTADGEQPIDALPSWVLVAPPDYAPGIPPIVTMYDVLTDLAVKRGVLGPPQTVVFDRHIRPILERAVAHQWVNRSARLGFDDMSGGHASAGPGDFISKMAQLGDPTVPNGDRERIFRFLRDPKAAPRVPNPRGMPRLNDDNDTGDVFALTQVQYDAMRLWAQGQFVATAEPVDESEPDRITREALESCSGGPFFPGIEAGRIMRDPSIFMQGEALRLFPDRVKPGEITQGNALPWQADYHLCRWEEGQGPTKRLGWWPAQRPDDVLASPQSDPVSWARGLKDDPIAWVNNWHRLGFVKEDPAAPGLFIEQERESTMPDHTLVS